MRGRAGAQAPLLPHRGRGTGERRWRGLAALQRRFEKPPSCSTLWSMTARKIMLDPPAAPAPDADETARVARYRALIQEGLDELAAGQFEVVEDIDAWLDTLGRRAA
ncbi:hypothetical protein CC_2982 [Caulobacter vibrioides CB15]|uniref:Uncharacterized protein n=2 Tax=Caulobacter vibrioides TaxID=155892 RepID=Q9A461_CAUVC|nr:hypothetical protein CC_2982 [Caulobacter vibrioides CB15]ATC29815.1 hypothetical protein CA607_16060 [Caulobacter vibrioides]